MARAKRKIHRTTLKTLRSGLLNFRIFPRTLSSYLICIDPKLKATTSTKRSPDERFAEAAVSDQVDGTSSVESAHIAGEAYTCAQLAQWLAGAFDPLGYRYSRPRSFTVSESSALTPAHINTKTKI